MKEISGAELLAADLNLEEFRGARILVSGGRRSGKTDLLKKFSQRWGAPLQTAQSHAQMSGLCESVAEEISLGIETRVIHRAELIRRVEEIAHQLGIDHIMRSNPLELSGGQSQLTVLAAYLVMKPEVFVVDELLTGLDLHAQKRVLETLKQYEGILVWSSCRPTPGEKDLATHRVLAGEEQREDSFLTRPAYSLAGQAEKGQELVLRVEDLGIHPTAGQGSTWFPRASSRVDPLVCGLNFHVASAETVAVMGANGSGKSTLLRTLAGIIPPVRGEVRIHGKNPGEIEPQERVKLVSLATQHPAHHFLARSVEAELSLEPAGASAESFRRELLELTGLLERREEHPHDLSPVEQHLLALATAVAVNPAVLLLDEPTARLDARGVHQTQEIIRRFSQSGGVSLIATHDREFLAGLEHRQIQLDQV